MCLGKGVIRPLRSGRGILDGGMMKEIVKLRYFAAAVLLGACLVIGFTMKYADKIDGFDPRMNDFPKNWEQMEKGHPVEIYTPTGIPQYSAIWRGVYEITTTVTN